jgi:hypothetical protein
MFQNVINSVHSLFLLHVSAAHGPSSGNTYYLGRPLHCTHFLSTLRHIVVVVSLLGRINKEKTTLKHTQLKCTTHLKGTLKRPLKKIG